MTTDCFETQSEMQAVVLAVCLFALGAAAQDYTTINLNPFTNVQVCVPFNVAIQPGPSYAVQIAADQAVKNAFQATVGSGGVLSLQTNGAFTTTQPIQCIVSLPAAQLAGVTVLAPQTQVLLRNGFNPSKLTAAVAGSSTLLANGIAAASGSLSASG